MRLGIFIVSAASVGLFVFGVLQAKRKGSAEGAALVGGEVTSRLEPSSPDEKPIETDWPCLLGPEGKSSARHVSLSWPPHGPNIRWRIPIGERYSSPVAKGDDVIVFHRPSDRHDPQQPGPLEVITCADARAGTVRWEYSSTTNFECRTHYSHGPYSTPVVDDHQVYAWGTEGNLYCLRKRDGQLVWQRNLLAEYGVKLEGYFPVATSPLIWDDRLIVAVGAAEAGAGIVAVAKDDGRTLWAATDQAASYATPCAATLHGRPHVFVLTKEGLVALDPRTGTEDWRIRFRANNPEFVNATTPIVHGDLVFVSAFSLGNLCVRVLPGGYEEVWRDLRRNLDSQYSPLIAIDGFVYGFAALDDTFRCLELRSGKLKWSGLRELDRGAAIATRDSFLILGTEGYLAMAKINPSRLEILGQTKKPLLEGPTYAFPALHRGRLLVRNHKELVSIGFE